MRIDNLKRAKEILNQLIDEKHPYTKESLSITDVVCDERVHQWLCFVDEEISNLILKCETEKPKKIKKMNIKTEPGICPLCKSNNIDFGESDFSSKDTFFHECVCCDCGTKYIEVFKYTHSEIREKGE